MRPYWPSVRMWDQTDLVSECKNRQTMWQNRWTMWQHRQCDRTDRQCDRTDGQCDRMQDKMGNYNPRSDYHYSVRMRQGQNLFLSPICLAHNADSTQHGSLGSHAHTWKGTESIFISVNLRSLHRFTLMPSCYENFGPHNNASKVRNLKQIMWHPVGQW